MKLKSVVYLFIIITACVVAVGKTDNKENDVEKSFYAKTRDDSGTFGNNFKWYYNSSSYTLTIEGEGDMQNFTSSSSTPWYDYLSSISIIEFKGDIKSIGNFAFYGCNSLTSLTLSQNLISIGISAFNRCNKLTSITIPSNVTSIGYYTFLWMQ